MALRLDSSVVRGEIDNRERGRVRGTIRMLGRSEPIRLDLAGNCWRDLAGCLLQFENPCPQPGNKTDFAAQQSGVVGDMTASRKVRVLDVSIEEAARLHDEGKPVPEHMANCLYLEWFSEANGRVVIESGDFQYTLSDRRWTLTEAEAGDQARANQQAIRDWLDRMREAGPTGDEPFDPEDGKPMDEFDWEKELRASDARTDKYMELLEKYRGHPDSEKLIAREMGWDWLEDALEADQRGAFDAEKKEMESLDDLPPLEPNPLTEGVDWVRDEDGDIVHPLQKRSSELAMEMWHYCDDHGLLGETGDEDLHQMIFQAQTLSAKLAGALNHLGYDSPLRDGGLIVASLKRALTYLNGSLTHAEKVAGKNLLEPDRLERFRQSLFEIREEMLALMERFRGG
jgi:hypothetical protein